MRAFRRRLTGLLLAICVAALIPLHPARTARDGVPDSVVIAPAENPAIAATLRQLDPDLVRALVAAFATLPESDPALAAARARAGEIGARLGFSAAAVEGFLRILGDGLTPAEQPIEMLIRIVEPFAAARARLAVIAADDLTVRVALDEAKKALAEGRFGPADEALARAATAAGDSPSLSSAQIAAARGDIAMIRLLYPDAADHYRQAAALMPEDQADAKGLLLIQQASAWLRHGDATGDDHSFLAAVVAYGAALQSLSRDRDPLLWGIAKSNLGDALAALGQADNATPRLVAAVTAYRAALQEVTRERAPAEWATTENNLGDALLTIGERTGEMTALQAAIAAYRAALQERTRERAPLAWAAAQNGLGQALWKIGEQQGDLAALQAAVAAFRAALLERTRERQPAVWPVTQNNLGNALRALGEREEGPEHLAEAVAAYRAALDGQPRDRLPLDWAMTQNNLGNALARLGERETGSTHLIEAVAAYRTALEVQTRDSAPLDWAMTQNNLGNALAGLGQRETGVAHLNEAITAFRAALLERTRDREPVQWAMTENNLGSALETLGERQHNVARLQEAVAAYDGALQVFSAVGAARYIEVCQANRVRAAALLAKTRY